MIASNERTPAQREAIHTPSELVVAVAGPGSGKTATLVARIKRLIDDGIDPAQIVAITFTNAAAREIENRLTKVIENKQANAFFEKIPVCPKLGHVGTLHSFALRCLRSFGKEFGYGDRLSVISPESASDLLVSKARTLGCKLALKDLLKSKALGRPPRGTRLDVASTVIAAYFDDLKEAGIVDLDVLLTEFRDLLETDGEARIRIAEAFEHVFVDEVQDSGIVDWTIYHTLPIANKFYVGDPDQAIYGFRGGRPDCLASAIANIPEMKLIVLEDNFRSRFEVCQAANSLMSFAVGERVQKNTMSTRGVGGSVEQFDPVENEGTEIGLIAGRVRQLIAGGADPCEIAVLARTNALARAFHATFKATGIPVTAKTVDDLPLDWTFVRSLVELLVNPENDTLAYFHLVALYKKLGADEKRAREMAHAVNKEASAASKTINEANLGFSRGLDAAGVVGILCEKGASLESRMIVAQVVREVGVRASALDFALAIAAVRNKEEPAVEGNGVEISTIHGAKGREWGTVFVVGCEDESMPGKRNDPEEERRLLYVAMTRAKDRLFFSWALSRVTEWGQIVRKTKSRFLSEFPARLP